MPLDSTSSPDEIRERTGWLIGCVRDRLVRIHTSCSDDAIATGQYGDLAYWLREAIETAAWNRSDHECDAVYNRLKSVEKLLGSPLDHEITAGWLQTSAAEIEQLHGVILTRLQQRLRPDWLDDPESYDPDYRAQIDELRQLHALQVGGPNIEVIDELGVKIDHERGTVRRRGDQYSRTTVEFDIASAEWHWVKLAVKHWTSGGATKAQIQNGYPGRRTPVAMRQAKRRASDKLRRGLDIQLSRRYPVAIIIVTKK